MNIKKYIFIAIGVFVAIVVLAIGISARFSLSNITADPYAFIENFFSQWSPALAAASTIIVAVMVFWTIYNSRRGQEKEKQRVIHALHDELSSNMSDIIVLRFRISEKFRKIEESHIIDTKDAPFQPIDTTVFDTMKNAGQLQWLQDRHLHIIFCYKLIKRYNIDGCFRPSHLDLLEQVSERLINLIRDLEANFKFLPQYAKDLEYSQQALQEESDTDET